MAAEWHRHQDCARTVSAPRGGYVISSAYAREIETKLALHGIDWKVLEHALENAEVEEFRAAPVDFSPKPFEGRMRATIEGSWSRARRRLPEAAVFVPMAEL